MKKILLNFSILAVYMLSWLPLGIIRFMGNMLGIIGYYFAANRRKVGLRNLTLCFPNISEQTKRRIIKQHFKDLLTAGLEYSTVFYGSQKRIKRFVEIDNLMEVKKYYLKRPIILLAPHFIGLELGAMRLSMEIDLSSIYSRQKSELLTKRLKKARLRFMTEGNYILSSRQEGLRNIIRHIKRTNTPFYYLPDQDFGENDSIYVPFFGQKSCATITTLAKLVKLTNAVVIPMATYRINNKYRVVLGKAWESYPEESERTNVIRMNKCIEAMIEPYIEQYFWLHKRFKTQPDGRHKLYKFS